MHDPAGGEGIPDYMHFWESAVERRSQRVIGDEAAREDHGDALQTTLFAAEGPRDHRTPGVDIHQSVQQ